MSEKNKEIFDPFFEEEQESGQTIKEYIDKFIAYWYLFVISVIICVGLAYLYGKTAQLGYQINSTILVKDEKSGPSGGKGLMGDMDLSSLLGSSNSADNEIEILKSRSLMTKVVQQLQLHVTNSIKGKFKTAEVQDAEVPYTIVVSKQADSVKPQTYLIDQITQNGFHIVNEGEGIDQKGFFGKAIVFPQFTMLLNLKPGFRANPLTVYRINVQSIDSKVEALMGGFDAALTNKQSTVIALGLKYGVPSKGEQILQTLMNVYLEDNLLDKKRIADSTLNFINGQLAGVSGDLKSIEAQIEVFKEDNNLADMDTQSKELVTNASEYFKKLNDAEIQLNVLESISAYINNPKNKRIIPSSLNVQDPVFAKYVEVYNQLIMQRDRDLLSYTEENPNIRHLDEQIENTRQNVLKSFSAYQNNLKQVKNELGKNNSRIGAEIRKVPKKERVFLDFSRQQNLRQQLYLFLLEKREETAISRTSTFSSSQILDNAKSARAPYAPKKMTIYLAGLMAGLILPLAFLSIREMLNTKIQHKKDITKQTQLPIAGEIGHNTEGEGILVDNHARSVVSEQFRGLRTNLQFMLPHDGSKVIMITSSMSGEGKSFISLNLANTLAITGKKVVLMELDLRKPKLSINLSLDNQSGYSNYIAGSSLKMTDIVKPTGVHQNISIISSGPIPPNPAELLLSEKLGTLINELKGAFDYVIIDTAPVGLVSDALLIEKNVDLSLYVARQKVTYKSQLNIINDLVAQHKLRKAALIINDISSGKNNYYGYGYGYGYGGYAEDQPKKWWQKLRS